MAPFGEALHSIPMWKPLKHTLVIVVDIERTLAPESYPKPPIKQQDN